MSILHGFFFLMKSLGNRKTIGGFVVVILIRLWPFTCWEGWRILSREGQDLEDATCL